MSETVHRQKLTEWFSSSLKRVSKQTGKPLKELCTELPQHYTYLSKMMNGHDAVTTTSAARVRALAVRFNVPIDTMPAYKSLSNYGADSSGVLVEENETGYGKSEQIIQIQIRISGREVIGVNANVV